MAKKLKPDRILFFVTLVLVGFGVAMVFSSSAIVAKEKFGDPNYFSFKQLIFAALGLAVMFVVMKVDYHMYRQPAVVFSALGDCRGVAGSRVLPCRRGKYASLDSACRFFDPAVGTGEAGLDLFPGVLPGEAKGKRQRPDVYAGPGCRDRCVAGWPDRPAAGPGHAVSLAGHQLSCLLFVAGLDLRWIAVSAIFAVPAFYFLVFRVKYRRERILAFMNPWDDPLGRGFQIIQSLLSVASGGIVGLGFMEGKQKLFYLPEAHTDFIFAVVGEELGLIGTCAAAAAVHASFSGVGCALRCARRTCSVFIWRWASR